MNRNWFAVTGYIAIASFGSGLFGNSGTFVDIDASDPPKHGESFLIVNANSGRCLAEKDGSIVQGPIASGANLNDHWRFLKHDDYYEIVNVKSGKRVTLPDASRNVGTNLSASNPFDGEELHQQWHFDKVGSDYAIRSPVSGLVAAVAEASQADGFRVLQWTWYKGKEQIWILKRVSDPPQHGESFLIVNANSGRCLAEKDELIVQGRSTSEAIIDDHWRFLKHDDYHEIVNVKSGKRVTLPDASRNVGSNLSASNPYDGEELHQQWHFDKVGSHYAIRSPVSGLVASVAEGSHADGFRVLQWTWYKGKEQIWILQRVSERDEK